MIGSKLLFVLALFWSAVLAASPVSSATQTETPAKGSAERKAILDAVRTMVKKMSELDVIFVVRHLKVNKKWAWVEVDPRSADNAQHYEAVSGLLAKKNGHWEYIEGPPEWPVCEVDPDCADTSRYFKKLARKYPSVSPDIFPTQ